MVGGQGRGQQVLLHGLLTTSSLEVGFQGVGGGWCLASGQTLALI